MGSAYFIPLCRPYARAPNHFALPRSFRVDTPNTLCQRLQTWATTLAEKLTSRLAGTARDPSDPRSLLHAIAHGLNCHLVVLRLPHVPRHVPVGRGSGDVPTVQLPQGGTSDFRPWTLGGESIFGPPDAPHTVILRQSTLASKALHFDPVLSPPSKPPPDALVDLIRQYRWGAGLV